jgi:hypothetical protein
VRFKNPVQLLEDSQVFLVVGAIGTGATYKPCSSTRGFSNISVGRNERNRCDLQTLFNYSRILEYERTKEVRFTNPVQLLEDSRVFLLGGANGTGAIYTHC